MVFKNFEPPKCEKQTDFNILTAALKILTNLISHVSIPKTLKLKGNNFISCPYIDESHITPCVN